MPATIFVTAWEKYAVAAFDMAAVHYRAPTDRLRDGMLALLQAHGVGAPDPATTAAPVTDTRQASGFIERLAVDIRGTVRPVLVRDIDFIEASGPYAELHVGTHRYVIRASMQYLEDASIPRTPSGASLGHRAARPHRIAQARRFR